MTELLEKAVAETSKLPQPEQDIVAARILEDLEERKEAQFWLKELAGSDALLDRLAAEALEEHLQGKTRPLDELLDEPL